MSKQLAITSGAVHKVGKKAYLTVGGVHRKIAKMYRTTNGIHQLCYKGGVDVATMVIGYSGNMIDDGVVTMSGKQYRLLTLTSSGTLTVDDEVNAEVWMCGGGTSGVASYSIEQSGGGAGAYTAQKTITLAGDMAAVIGAGGGAAATSALYSPGYNKGGASSFGGVSTSTAFSVSSQRQGGVSGGTGGGENVRGAGATGDGVTKYPFGDSSYFAHPHCAGGGSGAMYYDDKNINSTIKYYGGSGGTNGGNGAKGSTGNNTVGSGGNYGGGNGGSATGGRMASVGADATYYGSGGGGGGGCIYITSSGSQTVGQKYGGAGYQGVIYIRIPVEQSA